MGYSLGYRFSAGDQRNQIPQNPHLDNTNHRTTLVAHQLRIVASHHDATATINSSGLCLRYPCRSMNHITDDKARKLREAVMLAHKAYLRAAEESHTIMKDVPSGLPHPDGAHRIANAAQAERHALAVYMNAMLAFNDYMYQKPRTP